MVVKKSKTALLLKADPNAELTLKGQAPRIMTEEGLNKLALAREKLASVRKAKKEALKNIKQEAIIEPIIEPKKFEEEPEEGEEEEEPIAPIIKKKEKKKPKKPVVIIEESSSESDDGSNVIYIKKRSKPKNFPAQLPTPADPQPPPIARQDFVKPVFSRNPFYNYNGY